MALRRRCWSPTAGCTPPGIYLGSTKVLVPEEIRLEIDRFFVHAKENHLFLSAIPKDSAEFHNTRYRLNFRRR
jgi:hypothetical protein